jgi:hypothetical protein
MRDHGRAGARRHDDGGGIAKDIQKMPRDAASFFCVAGIKGGLSAAGLSFGEINLKAQAFQHLGDGDSDLGENLVDNASDEQGDARVQSGSLTWERGPDHR